jgi:oligopeptide transport system substrate-binding protein
MHSTAPRSPPTNGTSPGQAPYEPLLYSEPMPSSNHLPSHHSPPVGPRVFAILASILIAAGTLSCSPASKSKDAHLAGSTERYFGDTTPPEGQVFRFTNGAEPETIDPGLMSGQPDGRVARILFEGLTVPDPKTLEPLPGQAYRWDISADGLTYTFHLRPGLRWTDGVPITARDFVWSWMRVLEPKSAARYAGLLYMIENAEAFNKDTLGRPPRVGIDAPDDSTLVVRLKSPTPYFLFLTQYYTYLPVPRHVIEKHGRRWTLPENLVNNGPFRLAHWRQNNRFEFVRNPRYWDAGSVRLDRIVAYSIDDLNTCTNLYKAGVSDWTTSGNIPSPFIPYLRQFGDYQHGRYQGTYFYSINVTRKPLDNVWLRRALNYAIDREAIARDLLKRSYDPWGNYTPSGYPGYTAPPPITYDPEKARECLKRAGYASGADVPRFSIVFNTSENHRRIAEAVQSMWKRVLGISIDLSNQEWGSYLQATTSLQYDVARRSWIGDYLDPNTFLNMMVTGDGNNRTGWSDPRYDAMIREASFTVDPAKRLEILSRAEALLLEASPTIPIYHYSVNDLVKPYVRGLYATTLDTHPMKFVYIEHDWRRKPATLAARLSRL